MAENYNKYLKQHDDDTFKNVDLSEIRKTPKVVADDIPPPDVDSRKPSAAKAKIFMKEAGKAAGKSLLRRIGYHIGTKFPMATHLGIEIKDKISDIRTTTQDTISEMRPELRQIRRSTQRLIPRTERFLPPRLRAQLRAMQEGWEDPYEGPETAPETEEERRNKQIEKAIKDTASKQATMTQVLADEQRTDKQLDRITTSIRHKQLALPLRSIEKSVASIDSYNRRVHIEFLKKGLSVKYQHLFVAQDILEKLSSGFAVFETKLEEIKHNTGLPEYMLERGIEKGRRKRWLAYGEKVGDTIFSTIETALSSVSGRIIGATKTAATAASTADMASGMMEDMDFDDMPEEMKGARDSGKIFGWIGGKLAGIGLVKKLLGGVGDQMEETDDAFAGAGDRAGMWLQELTRAEKKKGTFLGDMLDAVVPKTGLDKYQEEDISDTDAVPWDKASRTSIIEVIPSYLSRQLQTLQDIAYGPGHEAQVWDPQKKGLVGEEQFKTDVLSRAFGEKKERLASVTRATGVIRHAAETKGREDTEFESLREDIMRVLLNHAIRKRRLTVSMLEAYTNGNEAGYDDEYINNVFEGVAENQRHETASYITDALTNPDGTVDQTVYRAAVNYISRQMKRSQYQDIFADLFEGYGHRHQFKDIIDPETGELQAGRIGDIHMEAAGEAGEDVKTAQQQFARKEERRRERKAGPRRDEPTGKLDRLAEPWTEKGEKAQAFVDEKMSNVISMTDRVVTKIGDMFENILTRTRTDKGTGVKSGRSGRFMKAARGKFGPVETEKTDQEIFDEALKGTDTGEGEEGEEETEQMTPSVGAPTRQQPRRPGAGGMIEQASTGYLKRISDQSRTQQQMLRSRSEKFDTPVLEHLKKITGYLEKQPEPDQTGQDKSQIQDAWIQFIERKHDNDNTIINLLTEIQSASQEEQKTKGRGVIGATGSVLGKLGRGTRDLGKKALMGAGIGTAGLGVGAGLGALGLLATPAVLGYGAYKLLSGIRGKGKKEGKESKADSEPQYTDVYRKDEIILGQPLLSANKQHQGVICAIEQQPLAKTKDIKGPVLDGQPPHRALITQEDYDHGLVDIQGNPIVGKIKSRKGKPGILGSIIIGLGKAVGGIGKGYGSAVGGALGGAGALGGGGMNLAWNLLSALGGGIKGAGKGVGKAAKWGWGKMFGEEKEKEKSPLLGGVLGIKSFMEKKFARVDEMIEMIIRSKEGPRVGSAEYQRGTYWDDVGGKMTAAEKARRGTTGAAGAADFDPSDLEIEQEGGLTDTLMNLWLGKKGLGAAGKALGWAGKKTGITALAAKIGLTKAGLAAAGAVGAKIVLPTAAGGLLGYGFWKKFIDPWQTARQEERRAREGLISRRMQYLEDTLRHGVTDHGIPVGEFYSIFNPFNTWDDKKKQDMLDDDDEFNRIKMEYNQIIYSRGGEQQLWIDDSIKDAENKDDLIRRSQSIMGRSGVPGYKIENFGRWSRDKSKSEIKQRHKEIMLNEGYDEKGEPYEDHVDADPDSLHPSGAPKDPSDKKWKGDIRDIKLDVDKRHDDRTGFRGRIGSRDEAMELLGINNPDDLIGMKDFVVEAYNLSDSKWNELRLELLTAGRWIRGGATFREGAMGEMNSISGINHVNEFVWDLVKKADERYNKDLSILASLDVTQGEMRAFKDAANAPMMQRERIFMSILGDHGYRTRKEARREHLKKTKDTVKSWFQKGKDVFTDKSKKDYKPKSVTDIDEKIPETIDEAETETEVKDKGPLTSEERRRRRIQQQFRDKKPHTDKDVHDRPTESEDTLAEKELDTAVPRDDYDSFNDYARAKIKYERDKIEKSISRNDYDSTWAYVQAKKKAIEKARKRIMAEGSDEYWSAHEKRRREQQKLQRQYHSPEISDEEQERRREQKEIQDSATQQARDFHDSDEQRERRREQQKLQQQYHSPDVSDEEQERRREQREAQRKQQQQYHSRPKIMDSDEWKEQRREQKELQDSYLVSKTGKSYRSNRQKQEDERVQKQAENRDMANAISQAVLTGNSEPLRVMTESLQKLITEFHQVAENSKEFSGLKETIKEAGQGKSPVVVNNMPGPGPDMERVGHASIDITKGA